MTSRANGAGTISTLGKGDTRLNRLINAQNGGVPSLISYPARPIQGGRPGIDKLLISSLCARLLRIRHKLSVEDCYRWWLY